MTRNLRFEMVYPYPPETVWKAITTREAIAEWLMENDFEPRVGHRFQFRAKPMPGWSGIVDAEVLELEPPRRMVLAWRSEVIDTRVTFQLVPVASGTRLVLEHDGFRGMKAMMVSMILGSGWKSILRDGLPQAIERMEARTGSRGAVQRGEGSEV
jgi:uncharacterized protein YndB with AHSA1/START domain